MPTTQRCLRYSVVVCGVLWLLVLRENCVCTHKTHTERDYINFVHMLHCSESNLNNIAAVLCVNWNVMLFFSSIVALIMWHARVSSTIIITSHIYTMLTHKQNHDSISRIYDYIYVQCTHSVYTKLTYIRTLVSCKKSVLFEMFYARAIQLLVLSTANTICVHIVQYYRTHLTSK